MEGQPCGSGVNLCGGRNVEGHTHKLLSAYWRVAVVLDSIESVKQVVRDDLRVTIHFSPMRAVCSDFGRTPNIADGPLLRQRDPFALDGESDLLIYFTPYRTTTSCYHRKKDWYTGILQ